MSPTDSQQPKRAKTLKFKCPSTVKHRETRILMKGIVDELNESGRLSVLDIPQLHRMATSYDTYLEATKWMSENDVITVNKKGEEVKHPMVNIQREAWDQFLRIGREYGLTTKSRAQIQAHKPAPVETDDPIDRLIPK